MKNVDSPRPRLDPKYRFLERRKTLVARPDVEQLAKDIRQHLATGSSPERLASILRELMPDEATDIVGTFDGETRERVLALLPAEEADAIRTLLAYPKESAGGIMTSGFVAVPETATPAEAVGAFVNDPNAEHQFYIYALDEQGALCGVLDLRQLLRASPTTRIGDIMIGDVLHVPPDMDQEHVALLFSRYDLLALPVVEPGTNKLLGVITADDVIDVIEYEGTEDVMRTAGSDAQELERRSPTRIALLRLPWIMATMFIELLAGVVIHFFDSTLTNVILLASFMPIISAISGNTGLQSATIIVRGLSTGQGRLTHWQSAVLRQVKTTLILG